jgi:signal transduction histidine kinase/CheY-like chemotaxis protein
VSQSGFDVLAPAEDSTSRQISRAVSIAAGVYAILGGIGTLIGWATDTPRLTDWNNDGISMFPNTAMCAIMSGAALLHLVSRQQAIAWRAAARILAIVVIAIAAASLFQHIANVNLGIDTLLFNKPWGQRASMAPMRMGPPASVSFIILGSALLLAGFSQESRRFASELALLVVIIASLSLIGYWFGADKLFVVARITGIALQTSTVLIVLGIGIMAAVPEHGIVAALQRDDAGGTVMRRLIVPIIAVPLVLGWLRIVGQQAGLYDMAFGTALRTLVEVVLLVGLLWWTANGISQHALAARRAEESLKEANRRKDEFLATLAHELRNPLAPIGNALAIIKHSGGDSETVHQVSGTMDRQFRQMVRLVDDLLDVSRISRDRLELRPQRIELASVVRQAVEASRVLAECEGHQLQVALPAATVWVNADPVRMAQVFSNLLNNACKFTDPGGLISIKAEKNDGHVFVSVADTGIGISAEKLDSIFEIFEQVDKTLERTRGGLGIGLTLVKRLVELHGGSIEAQSAGLGAGSTFVVRLPVVDSSASQQADAAPGAPQAGTPRRIFIADDNRDAANSLAMLLKIGGHDVQTAYDGLEALEKVEAYRPDLILLDIGMPGMNGHDVCRFIRQQSWGKDVEIVALTGWSQDKDRRLTREAGFDHHLVKPVEADALKEILRATT